MHEMSAVVDPTGSATASLRLGRSMYQQQEPTQTLAQRLSARVHELMWERHFEAAEVFSALGAIGWGLTALLPWDSFATAMSWDAMGQLLPEWAWGLLILACGVAQLWALLADHWQYRRWAAMTLVVVWIFIGVTVGVANPIALNISAYLIFGLMSGWAYLRMRAVF